VRVVCVYVTDGARVLMVKRPSGLLAGTWALPDAESALAAEPSDEIALRVATGSGIRGASFEYRGAVRHVFTHRDVTAEVFRADVPTRDRSRTDRRWVAAAGLGALGVSTFTRKTLALGVGAAKQDRAGFRP